MPSTYTPPVRWPPAGGPLDLPSHAGRGRDFCSFLSWAPRLGPEQTGLVPSPRSSSSSQLRFQAQSSLGAGKSLEPLHLVDVPGLVAGAAVLAQLLAYLGKLAWPSRCPPAMFRSNEPPQLSGRAHNKRSTATVPRRPVVPSPASGSAGSRGSACGGAARATRGE